jgi:hypothetical protein
MRPTNILVLIAFSLMPVLSVRARAQTPDHLKCYKIKDSAPKALYTADLQGLAPEPGCHIKVPGTMLCVPTTKANVQPTPPGAPAGSAAGAFVCYKVKCVPGTLAPISVSDQFGTRTVTPKVAKLLCAPEGVTTTSTTTSTTTTTLPDCTGSYVCYLALPSEFNGSMPWCTEEQYFDPYCLDGGFNCSTSSDCAPGSACIAYGANTPCSLFRACLPLCNPGQCCGITLGG